MCPWPWLCFYELMWLQYVQCDIGLVSLCQQLGSNSSVICGSIQMRIGFPSTTGKLPLFWPNNVVPCFYCIVLYQIIMRDCAVHTTIQHEDYSVISYAHHKNGPTPLRCVNFTVYSKACLSEHRRKCRNYASLDLRKRQFTSGQLIFFIKV